jgi:hemolysin activation/secretion protein
MNLKLKPLTLSISLLLCASNSLPSYAETPVEPLKPDAGLLMRESRIPAIVPKPKPESEVEKPEAARPAMLPQNDLKVTVKNFLFTGNTQFSNSDLAEVLSKYTNHQIRFNDLEAAANAITQYYREAGFFLALAYLPQQSIKEGQVEIAILEGQLDNTHLTSDTIQTIGEVRMNKSVIKQFLDTYSEGELVTEKDMNRISLLINELPGIDGTVVLAPGKKTNTSSLSLKVKEQPMISGYATANNHGLYSTGYFRFDGGVTINNPLGIGDQLNLRAQTTDSAGSTSGSADYSLPVNGYGTRFTASISELHYNLGRQFVSAHADGIARTVAGALSHPFWLARNGRLTGTARYEHRWMEDKNPAGNTDRELNVMSFSFSGSYYDQLLALGGLTQGYINVSAGEVGFNNKSAFNTDQLKGGLNSNGGYHKFAWQVSRTQNILDDLSLFTNFQGQVASKNLDTSERMSLGGPSAIRAYPAGEGSGAEGWMFNGEARYHIPEIPYVPGYLQLIGFIDTGYSRVNAIPLVGDNSRHLTGYGFGLNWLEVSGFNLRTSIAWRDTKKQPTSDPTSHGAMMYFQLIKTF